MYYLFFRKTLLSEVITDEYDGVGMVRDGRVERIDETKSKNMRRNRNCTQQKLWASVPKKAVSKITIYHNFYLYFRLKDIFFVVH